MDVMRVSFIAFRHCHASRSLFKARPKLQTRFHAWRDIETEGEGERGEGVLFPLETYRVPLPFRIFVSKANARFPRQPCVRARASARAKRTYIRRAVLLKTSGNDPCTRAQHLTASLKHYLLARARLTALLYSYVFLCTRRALMYIKIQLPHVRNYVHRTDDATRVQMLRGVLPRNVFRF